jgi:hypothetical protein
MFANTTKFLYLCSYIKLIIHPSYFLKQQNSIIMKNPKHNRFWFTLFNIFKRKDASEKTLHINESNDFDIDWEAIPAQ